MPVPVDLKKSLSELTPTRFVSRWLFESTPFVFKGNNDHYIEWKHALGEKIKVDPRAIVLVGTAAIGTSFNPNKNFKPFDDSSDIDIGIISQHHFDIVWRWMRALGSERYSLSAAGQSAVKSHEQGYLFRGVIATDKILQYTPLAQIWVPALAEMAALNPTRGREINARLYADFDALRAYHVESVRAITRRALESK